jgi:hypothetical protein
MNEISGLKLCENCNQFKMCFDPSKAHIPSSYIKCKFDAIYKEDIENE